MAMEPITVFARIADPHGVVRILRELAPTVQIDGPDDSWQNAVVSFGKGKTKQTLTFTHDPAYYSEPNWSKQMSGMRGYFSRFPDTERKERVMMLTTALRFSLGTLFEPDFDPQGDPRLDILFAITELVDGVLFTPSALRDARGRILFGSGGEDDEDPEAVWPRVLAELSVSDPVGEAVHQASLPRPSDQEEADAPTAERVARRALALTALTARVVFEQDISAPEAEPAYQALLGWVKDIGIEEELEPEEWEVLQRPLGRLDTEDLVTSIWRLEGLVILAWALDRFEVPPHDDLVEMNPLWRSLGFLDAEAARALLASPTLRPRAELAELRGQLFALHWRLRNYYVKPENMDFVTFAQSCWFGPLNIAGLPIIEGDLAIEGERIDRCSPDAFATAHSAAQERHQAANWLWEGPASYSQASVAT